MKLYFEAWKKSKDKSFDSSSSKFMGVYMIVVRYDYEYCTDIIVMGMDNGYKVQALVLELALEVDPA